MVGQRFGRLVVLAVDSKDANYMVFWYCRCDCGNNKVIVGTRLRNGKTKSCGCLAREQAASRAKARNATTPPRKTHGLRRSPEYRAWQNMKKRCLSPNAVQYPYYGLRGISICAEWMRFESFYADMGPKPSRVHSLDRKDNDGNYEPGNCRWATKVEQATNRRARGTALAA